MTKLVVNGNVLGEAEAHLSVLDWGVLYGFGIYETMKAVSGKVLKLEKHLNRLRGGASEIIIPIPWTNEAITKMIKDTLKANNLYDAYVRLTVTRGVGEPGLRLTNEVKPNIFIIARPLPENIRGKQENGVKAAVSERHVRCTGDVRCRVKTTNYMMNALAKLDADTLGVEELILLNERGQVVEFSSANLFIVEDGKLVTPPIGSGILPGVTRETVLELARENSVGASEEDITVDRLRVADEVFKTSAVQGLIPVVSLDGKSIGDGKPGETTRTIQKLTDNKK